MIHFVKNLLISFFAILSIILFSFASDGANVQSKEGFQWRSMVIIDKNGQEFDINLSDQLKIAFDNGNMIITNALNNVAIALNDILEWQMSERLYDEDILSDQHDIISNSAINIYYSENHIKISSVMLSGLLTVIDMKGQVIKESLVNGNADIDISDLTKGIYLITFANKSMKIIIK